MKYGEERIAYFNSIGIKVIRFANRDCDQNFAAVCTAIDSEVKLRVDAKIK